MLGKANKDLSWATVVKLTNNNVASCSSYSKFEGLGIANAGQFFTPDGYSWISGGKVLFDNISDSYRVGANALSSNSHWSFTRFNILFSHRKRLGNFAIIAINRNGF